MLPAKHRLKKDRDFQRVLAGHNKALCGPLLVFSVPGEAETARFGVVVSKKVSKKAVERNKIRRQIAELLRPVAENFQTPLDVVLLVLRSAEFSQYQQGIETWQKKQQSS
ncbi:MAG TPA: ribonuclease P protein component [Candidatus Saccharimonadales bacterium]|nr:ribonuclease P protein component [Candidatus Saccharimonadales bacterium]